MVLWFKRKDVEDGRVINQIKNKLVIRNLEGNPILQKKNFCKNRKRKIVGDVENLLAGSWRNMI